MRDWRVREAEGGSARPSNQKTRAPCNRSATPLNFFGLPEHTDFSSLFYFVISVIYEIWLRAAADQVCQWSSTKATITAKPTPSTDRTPTSEASHSISRTSSPNPFQSSIGCCLP